jgi:DNA-binding CsgD family transcriptional regulator
MQNKNVESADVFTPRQMEVLKGLWQGKPNRAIANELHMRESTVKVHVRHIMHKLHAQNRTQIVSLTLHLRTPALQAVPADFPARANGKVVWSRVPGAWAKGGHRAEIGGLMSLSFRPNRAVYDVAGGVVWFFATDGPLLVRCGVLKQALAAIHHLQTERPEIPEQVFQRHRERIQEVATRKYRAEQFDRPGVILVRAPDLAGNWPAGEEEAK